MQATVLEIKADPNVPGVGINQPANSLRAMRKRGVFDEVCESGFEVDRIDFKDADGNLIVSSPYNPAADGTPHAARRRYHPPRAAPDFARALRPRGRRDPLRDDR